MAICRSCGSSINGKFCSNCGAPATAGAALECPRCQNAVAPNTMFCTSCGTALRPQYPQQAAYPYQPVQPQQNSIGKYLMGALGGAAAVLGGEMLLHDVERGIEHHVERDGWGREWGGGPHHHHHHHHRH